MTRGGESLAPGACKLCRSRWFPEINRRLREGQSAADIQRYVAEVSKKTMSVNRQTVYRHRDFHLDQPGRPAPPAPLAAEASPGSGREIKPTTNDKFLETIRDIAFGQIEADPGAVTMKMGMEAVKILEQRKDRQLNMVVLAQILTGQVPQLATSEEAPAIEGEYREVAALLPSEATT